ncbi:hypothetical protein [Sphingobacterium faecium]|uniref:hypothetical protein n=1 Tax=Sphingobacterium faecium TaxID=34087 RepID=UPI003208DF6A
MKIFNLNSAHASISDEANSTATNKGLKTAILSFDKNRLQKFEDGLTQLQDCISIKFLRIHLGNFTNIEFEIINMKSIDKQSLIMPYINGFEKLDGYSKINFSLAQILIETFEIDELNSLRDLISLKTCREIKEILEKELDEEIAGSEYEEDIDDDFVDIRDFLENEDDFI